MLKIVENNKNPDFCIISPLKPGDKLSKDTKISVKRNKSKFVWATYESDNNVAKNFDLGLKELSKKVKIPDFVIKIDADTIWSRNTLDYMISALKNCPENIVYSYVSFEYQGAVNQKFPCIPFNPDRLKHMNYISSNSMFKYEILKKIPLVTDDYYRRLLDWAYFLKLLNNNYIGIPCDNGHFIAKSSIESISSGSIEDFKLKYQRVKNDFVL